MIMGKIKYLCFILLISFFSINSVSGSVNITFQSDNEKVIKIIDIDNGYSQISSNITNQTISLPYDNLNIKLYASNTKIQGNNASFILNNLGKVNVDAYLILWLALIIGLCFLAYKIFEGRI